MLVHLACSCTRILSDIRPLIQCCHPPLWPTLLKFEIAKPFGKHTQCLDGEDEFVVGVGDHAVMFC
jgi:hypothetical protein